MLPVVEIFYSLQGEGLFAGTPSIFIRLGGCNMTCPGLPCDTPRAVDVKTHSLSWKRYEHTHELLQDITLVARLEHADKLVDIVITGGEPVLYFSNHIFTELVHKLQADGHRITVETNATIDIDFERLKFARFFIYAMSVKLANSAEPYDTRVRRDVIASYLEHSPSSFFKFVVDSEECFGQIEDITRGHEKTKVYCMPKGATREELAANSQFVFEFCMRHRFCYSDRYHIRIYGKKDGV